MVVDRLATIMGKLSLHMLGSEAWSGATIPVRKVFKRIKTDLEGPPSLWEERQERGLLVDDPEGPELIAFTLPGAGEAPPTAGDDTQQLLLQQLTSPSPA
ncbi:Os05g0236875 [Oryza sativa Japonica Group]|uniref:Os05g0236875 protein n=1 Tax=Oryza sativa subsp. japonica TaxID=39947 RepID=A0A0P0WJQ3_ORYSJ|nr:Os05g0236875 [Oryza sativa Japonica Group]